MTKKDYIKIASVLRKYSGRDANNDPLARLIAKHIAGDLAKVIAADNPKFNRSTWDEDTDMNDKTNRIEQAKQLIDERLSIYHKQHEAVLAILETIATLKGRKNIDKTLKTAFDRLFPQYTSYYERGYLLSFSVWGDGLDYSNQVYLVISSDKVAVEGWAAVEEDARRHLRTDYIDQLQGEYDQLEHLEAIAIEIDDLTQRAKALLANDAPDGNWHRCQGPSYVIREVYSFMK
jgi:hypothetical protein